MYTVRVLPEKEFDELPYKKAKTSLGLADQKNGVAYVRDTGYNDVTKATINHELDELVAKVSPHEEDGIRYKNMSGLGGAGGGLIGNMIKPLKKFTPLISAGIGAGLNKDNRGMGALQGLFGGGIGQSIGSGLASGFKNFRQPGGTFGKALEGFGQGFKGGGTDYLGALPGMKGFGTDQPVGALAKFMNRGSVGGGGVSSSPTSALQPQDSGFDLAQTLTNASTKAGGSRSILDAFGGGGRSFTPNLKNIQSLGSGGKSKFNISDTIGNLFGGEGEGNPLLGIGTALAGNMFSPKVNVPDFSSISDSLRGQIESGGNPFARELGLNELTRGLESELGTPPSNAFNLGDIRGEEAKQKALNNYVNQWKSIRPGADFSNDPEFQRGYNDIQEQYDSVRAAQRDETTFQYNQQQLQQKYQYMQTALNLDASQMAQYVQLAQLDINQLMLQYGLSVGEAQQFKQLFGDLGQTIAQGNPNPLDGFNIGGQS